MIELKPCPFCGSEAKAVFNRRCNYVVCSNESECWCGMTCPVQTPEEAARIWNTRQPLECEAGCPLNIGRPS